MDSLSEAALRCGGEVVVHGYKDGRAPGSERLDAMGLEHHVYAAEGTSEDIAMLLAYEKGAELIVSVGTHSSMVEFFDKGRAGMASTFLRSDEHTSELQSLMRISYAVFCLKKKTNNKQYDKESSTTK